ncbi:DUF2190 family protein [Sphingobium abikonense]|uniref:DUF2190 family protein n=1 Tax=Sphingobium abikonense TaxID=86193 RepID=UPI003517EB3D
MQKHSIFTFSAIASVAVAAARFIGIGTGAHCAAGAKALGVTQTPAAAGEAVAVDVVGTAIVEAGGAILPWVPIKSDAAGKAIAQGGTGEVLGYAITSATAEGQKIEVLLKF